MDDRLHPATRAVLEAADPEHALTLARNLATTPPSDWDAREWLTIAAGAEPHDRDVNWLAVVAFAHENDTSRPRALDGLRARARLIAALGPDDDHHFRSLGAFVQRAEAFVGGDSPDTALVAYRTSRAAFMTLVQGDPERQRARDRFIRGRTLREFARVIALLGDRASSLPEGLRRWNAWSQLREENF